MALIFPEGWQALKPTGVAQRQIETLEWLANDLNDDYRIYHAVHWTRIYQGMVFLGEIDFAIVGPGGEVVLIEQKSGLLLESQDGLLKHYGAEKRQVAAQMARNKMALQQKLSRLSPKMDWQIDGLLYCPDYLVRQPETAGLPAERIIDASKKETLVNEIKSLLPATQVDKKRQEYLHRFFSDELQLVPEVSAMVGQSHIMYTRLSAGLSHWGRKIECHPHRIRVIGTAGSGKTQLALALLQDADAAARRVLYVCYNRPLADYLSVIAPKSATVATFHQLANRIARSLGEDIDFSRRDAYQQLETFMSDAQIGDEWLFDELIVDEGQDFEQQWQQSLMRLLKPEGRAWWMEDPMQNLYGRDSVDLPSWTILHADTNYRSPQDVLQNLQKMLGDDVRMETGSPLANSGVEIITYTDESEVADKTKTAISRALGARFSKSMMVLLSYRGREASQFSKLSHLGKTPLKRFTGDYDLLGNPIYSEGEVLIDTIYRFKGQSAPCVIFTEIDFDEWNDRVMRRLFVGMTRATMKLILVMSDRAHGLLLQRLADDAKTID
ncbi:MAG: ATP-binding domain-containing protein [Gammaproteobacteria bacterium]|nr:ATP-binding domain-containing protein [Gammaproteobacteria bacterium]